MSAQEFYAGRFPFTACGLPGRRAVLFFGEMRWQELSFG